MTSVYQDQAAQNVQLDLDLHWPQKADLENIVGKEENADNQHFLLFPQCFQKGFLFKTVIKVGIVGQRVNCRW